jgi:sigma-B regulation protein RsbU (phosphoserine phosphatase)
VSLEPGDLLVVVSDGIVEACNREGEFWDEDEVERVVLAQMLGSGGCINRLPQALCDAVDAFACGANQYDDMTVVAVRLG